MIGAVVGRGGAIRSGSGEIAQAAEGSGARTEGNASSLEQTASAITQMDERLKATADAAGRTVTRADQAINTVRRRPGGGGRGRPGDGPGLRKRQGHRFSVIEGSTRSPSRDARAGDERGGGIGTRGGDAGGAASRSSPIWCRHWRCAPRKGEARPRAADRDPGRYRHAVEAVQKVDGALSAISGDVTEVHGLLATIATDNQAQAAAITQVASTISSMDRSTQQNAAMVEETSAAARNLASETAHLADQAARFNTGALRWRIASRARFEPLPPEALPSMVRARQPVSAQGGR